MKIQDFKIGENFLGPGGLEHLCTDKGSRTITAILVTGVNPIFRSGPPYVQEEVVFDEIGMGKCASSEGDLIRAAMRNQTPHPGFTAEQMLAMMYHKFEEDSQRYCRKNGFRVDKCMHGDIIHAYAASQDENGWIIHYLSLKGQTFGEMPELEYFSLTSAGEQDYDRLFGKSE